MTRQHLDLLVQLVKTSFKLRYNDSILGFFWVLIKPLVKFALLYLIWTSFRGTGGREYGIKLLLGIIVFSFVNEGVVFGMNSLLDKAHIILKVNFPREIAVYSSIVMATINLIVNLLLLVGFIAFSGIYDQSQLSVLSILGLWGVFLFLLIFLSVMILGVSFFTSILSVYLRDLPDIFDVLFQIMFWATPIVYSVEDLGDSKISQIVRFNPLGWVIGWARSLVVDLVVPDIWCFLMFGLTAVIVLILGFLFFKGKIKRLAERF